jgi:hypothetical protein
MNKFIQLLREIIWCSTAIILVAMFILWYEKVFTHTWFKIMIAAI